MKIINLILFLTLSFVFSSCDFSQEQKTPRTVEIDLTKTVHTKNNGNFPDTLSTLKVAVSSMISPKETFIYYEELINYVSKKNFLPIEFKQRKTYQEVNDLLIRNEVDFAFICSGAYVEKSVEGKLEILAVPVSQGKPLYQAYVITHRTNNLERFEDFKGKSFAFTDPLSNTGYLFALKRVKELGSNSGKFFSKTFFTFAHDNSIQLVAKQKVDGAVIDGLILDYLKVFYPERVKDIKIVERSEYFGIPPVVVPFRLSTVTKDKLRKVFLEMDHDPEGKKILDKLFIDKFTLGNDSSYNSIRALKTIVNK